MGQLPIVSVITILSDDLSQAPETLRSLASQTYPNLEPLFLFSGKKNGIEAKELVDRRFPGAIVLNCRADETVARINAMVDQASGEFVTLLTTGDVYDPDRVSDLVNDAVQRNSGVIITYVNLLDHTGERVTSGHQAFKNYCQGLLSNIAAHPCLSFTLLWHDLVVSPGNLFFRKSLHSEVGGFSDFPNLYAYDFVLRASRREEPHITTTPTLSCRPAYLSNRLRPVQVVEDERAEVVRGHILEVLRAPPTNPLGDPIRSHARMFAGVPWSQWLADAVDGLVEKKRPTLSRGNTDVVAISNELSGRSFTLLTHELSLTGAPVIVLEMATLMRERGAGVRVVSPSDGPLRPDFEKRGIKIDLLPSFHPRLAGLQRALLARPESRLTLIGFAKWAGAKTIQLFKHRTDKRAREWFSKNMDGVVLINSVAAWVWVFHSLRAVRSPKVIWYIHETFDPKWMVEPAADELFRKSIAEGALSMIFGSDATRRVWTAQGYPGEVKYWSGIKSGDHAGKQAVALKPIPGKRVVLNVGSVGSRKGTRVLLEAFAIGRKAGIIGEDVELRIIGCPMPSGNQEARDIVLRAYESDLFGSVKIIGQIKPEAIPQYYDEADLYVHASFFDCMPIAILTAMARGMPIVATDVDGCGEAILNDKSGLLVPPRSPDQLAKAMSRLLNEEPLRERLAAGAREVFVEKLSVDATLSKVLAVFER